MHLYHRRRNVAAHVLEELKTITYATGTHPMEVRRKKNEKPYKRIFCLCVHNIVAQLKVIKITIAQLINFAIIILIFVTFSIVCV